MKWWKDLPVDLSMLWTHIKILVSYLIEDIWEIIKDLFK